MRKFLKQIFLFFLPLLIFSLIVIGSFYWYDPFKVVKHYDEFYTSEVELSRDYVGTEIYLRQKDKYDSFIFGSSRAGSGYSTITWKNNIDSLSCIYSFSVNSETIFGIHGKIKLIEEVGGQLRNALLIFDTDVTFNTYRNSSGHNNIKHPRVSGEKKNSFVMEFLKDYFFTGFFIPYLDYKIFDVKREYMKGFLDLGDDNSSDKIKYQPFNSEEREIKFQKKENTYYRNNPIFYSRDSIEIILPKTIKPQGVLMLEDIKTIFDKHNTKFKIVISPLYDQKKLNPIDLKILQEIFGEQNVFDYSGINIITKDIHNYYEISHYRKTVGDIIMEEIYNK